MTRAGWSSTELWRVGQSGGNWEAAARECLRFQWIFVLFVPAAPLSLANQRLSIENGSATSQAQPPRQALSLLERIGWPPDGRARCDRTSTVPVRTGVSFRGLTLRTQSLLASPLRVPRARRQGCRYAEQGLHQPRTPGDRPGHEAEDGSVPAPRAALGRRTFPPWRGPHVASGPGLPEDPFVRWIAHRWGMRWRGF